MNKCYEMVDGEGVPTSDTGSPNSLGRR